MKCHNFIKECDDRGGTIHFKCSRCGVLLWPDWNMFHVPELYGDCDEYIVKKVLET